MHLLVSELRLLLLLLHHGKLLIRVVAVVVVHGAWSRKLLRELLLRLAASIAATHGVILLGRRYRVAAHVGEMAIMTMVVAPVHRVHVLRHLHLRLAWIPSKRLILARVYLCIHVGMTVRRHHSSIFTLPRLAQRHCMRVLLLLLKSLRELVVLLRTGLHAHHLLILAHVHRRVLTIAINSNLVGDKSVSSLQEFNR